MRALIVAACMGMLVASVPFAGPANAQAVSNCPDNFDAFSANAAPLTCVCTADAVKNADARQAQFPVLGMDIYPSNSPICLSAVHAGVILRSGGTIALLPEPGRPAYAGVTRNGVTSRNFRQHKASYRIAATAPPAAALAAPVTPAPAIPAPTVPAIAPMPAQTAASICPDNFEAFAGTSEPLICACTAEAVKNAEARQAQNPVFGMDMYAAVSPICLSAVHAGAISRSGGTLTVVPEAGRDAYAGVTRNDITSRNARSERSSFRFAAATPAPAMSATAVPPAVSACPDTFAAFAGTSQPVICSCTGEAVKNADSRQNQYPVYGMDIYTPSSPVCLAAVHAGAIGRNGGTLTAIPEAGREAYPGVTRNGVTSKNGRVEKSSFRFAPPAQPIVVGGVPVQQPIAASIQQAGQVQLYIQFRFNSDDLDEPALPTLKELRDALTANPDLRLMLVGHTDSVGQPEYNRALSLRRAQAVLSWLAAQGVPPTRLVVDGKGPDQPIADNATDQGRALNRRVQALRMQ
jgi:outer membrane protein OmpA-like peptidoglycan-associated protein